MITGQRTLQQDGGKWMYILKNFSGLLRKAKTVKSQHGIAILTQFIELAKLRKVGIGPKG